jgi:hypothetical protein
MSVKRSRPVGHAILTPCWLLLAVIRIIAFTKRTARQTLAGGVAIAMKVKLISNFLMVFTVKANWIHSRGAR